MNYWNISPLMSYENRAELNLTVIFITKKSSEFLGFALGDSVTLRKWMKFSLKS
jgi:hypothetical protein